MRALFASLLALCALSCAPRPAAPPPAPALWRIADADSEIWLFGTVHVLPPDLRWRSEAVNAAFAEAEEFVTETDTGATASPAFQAMVQSYAVAPAGPLLSSRLSEADARALRNAARDNGLDIAALERLRPWYAALQISYAQAARAGHSGEAGVETVLAAEAQARGKATSALETPEQQIRVLADLPEDAQLHFLSVTLRQTSADEATLREMDSAWASGDVATLERLLTREWAEAGPVVHEALILRRNRAWADQIAARLDGAGQSFIAVGAAHLVGEGNVIALLRQRGITVEGP